MAATPLYTHPPFDQDKAHQFIEKLVSDVGAALRGGLSYIGDKLGIFAALAAAGPVTVSQLAARTGLNERYLREWLGAMVTAEYVDYDPGKGTYHLPPEHAAPLADENFRFFVGGFLEMIVPAVSMAPRVAEAFRDGKGVPQGDYPPEMFEAIQRGTAPWYKTQLVSSWIPAMPQVAKKLRAGGAALDVGCGRGVAAVTLAQAFPHAQVFGFDNHPGSIERARWNARKAGLGNRISFQVCDGCSLPENSFDFITTFDVVHDSVDPLGLLKSIRRALTAEGTCLMLEMNCSPNLQDNKNPVGRFLYAISTLYCMTVSLAKDGAGIGAAMGEPKARELAQTAGFQRFRKLPIDDPFSVLYELR